jgi:hypothetical protein
VAEGKEQYRKEYKPSRADTGGLQGFKEVKPEITLFQVSGTGAGEDHREPLKGAPGRLHPGWRRQGQDTGGEKGKGPSRKEEQGKGNQKGKKIIPFRPCKAPFPKGFDPPQEITQKRQGGQGKGENAEYLPACRKGQRFGKGLSRRKAGKKENKIEDQGFNKGIRGLLLLTDLSPDSIVLLYVRFL